MEETANKYLFEEAPVSKAVITMAVPTMISMLVTVIYNMADTFFIGQTGDSMQVAAVSLATPVFMLLMAVGNLFGIGGTSAISRALGEKRLDRARHISSFCCYASVVVGLLLAVIMWVGMGGILNLIGASENTYQYAKEYLTCIAFGGPFIAFAVCFGNIVRGEGAARVAMIGNLLGTVVNIILDPVFILLLRWGVRGAAVATVIGNVCAAVFYLMYFLLKKSSLSINPREFRFRNRIALDVIAIGLPASINSIMMSVANILLNLTLTKYGDIPLAAMGVAMKSNMIVIFLQIGLCTSIQPLIGYNYGSGNKKRLMAIFRQTIIFAVCLGTILTIIMVFARRFVVSVFINDPDVIAYGVKMVIALQMSGPFVGILFTCVNTIQGMGKALPSLILTFCRQGLVFIPMIFILDHFFGLNGVIYAQPVADYISIVIAVVICMLIFKNIHKQHEAYLARQAKKSKKAEKSNG